jgi:hypothetical protein
MKTKKLALCFLALTIATVTSTAPLVADASTIERVEVTCPLDGSKFKTIMAMSGTSFGQQLDLKPIGPIISPWPLARCPSNGFVIYKEKFSPKEIARLKKYVASSTYRALHKGNTDYYLAANLMEFMGDNTEAVAFALLQATWEVETEPKRYNLYAKEALAKYKQILTNPPTDKKKWVTTHLVAGELERRLGQFEEAQRRFLDIRGNSDLKTSPYPEIIALQLKLIEAKDSRPHQIPKTSGN